MLIIFPLLVGDTASMIEEPTTFMTRSEVEASVKEREGRGLCIIDLSKSEVSLRSEVRTKAYPVGYVSTQFQKAKDRRGNSKSM